MPLPVQALSSETWPVEPSASVEKPTPASQPLPVLQFAGNAGIYGYVFNLTRGFVSDKIIIGAGTIHAEPRITRSVNSKTEKPSKSPIPFNALHIKRWIRGVFLDYAKGSCDSLSRWIAGSPGLMEIPSAFVQHAWH